MDNKVFSLNAFKHHLLFVRTHINDLDQKETGRDINLLPDEIKEIGNNSMDLYTGNRSVEEIFREIQRCLEIQKIERINEFKIFLGTRGYNTMVLKDMSTWVLRLGQNAESYIHLHPARYGKHVIRLSGSAWKTALAAAILNYRIPQKLDKSIDRINYARINFLELSPVKRIIPGSSMDIALKLLGSNLKIL